MARPAMVRVDLHLHTSASHDCSAHPEHVFRQCQRLGLNPVFITDHDTVEGARALARAHPGEVVIGEEITTTRGELIGLFLTTEIAAGMTPEDAAQRIKEQGGVVYLQHPCDSFRRHLPIEAIERISELIDVVEVFNARADDRANIAAEDLRSTLGAAGGAGSDAHNLADIGGAYVELAPFRNRDAFLANLTNGVVVRRPSRIRMQAEARLAQLGRTRGGVLA